MSYDIHCYRSRVGEPDLSDKIETKTMSFSDETVTFNGSNWMTPAIWLDVPDDWRNKYSR